jgi:hypothetical protein
MLPKENDMPLDRRERRKQIFKHAFITRLDGLGYTDEEKLMYAQSVLDALRKSASLSASKDTTMQKRGSMLGDIAKLIGSAGSAAGNLLLVYPSLLTLGLSVPTGFALGRYIRSFGDLPPDAGEEFASEEEAAMYRMYKNMLARDKPIW